MDITLAPSACTASMVQLLTLSPLTMTTQAPHWLVSQPTWVPVSPRISRRNWTSKVRGSTVPDTFLPFTVMDTLGMVESLPRSVLSGPGPGVAARPLYEPKFSARRAPPPSVSGGRKRARPPPPPPRAASVVTHRMGGRRGPPWAGSNSVGVGGWGARSSARMAAGAWAGEGTAAVVAVAAGAAAATAGPPTRAANLE